MDYIKNIIDRYKRIRSMRQLKTGTSSPFSRGNFCLAHVAIFDIC